MEKLELKHLAPYLPYGLKFYWEDLKGNINKPWSLTINSIDFALENQNKPILRPLSDLINNEFEKELGHFTPDFKFNLDDTEYKFIEKMLKLHFDVFGLIEKGLAIDKNKLAQLK